MRIRSVIVFVSLMAVVTATTSCGDVVRSSRSPVMLVMNSLSGGTTPAATLLSDVVGSRTSPDPCSTTSPCPTVFNDPGTATLTVVMKDATVTPSSNNRVTINRYRVEFRRADGRNTPGVDVPHPFDGAVTLTIPVGSIGSTGFELVRLTAKEESPLVQLVVNPNIISTIATVTFFGQDLVGNDVSATGQILIEFGNFADKP